MPLPLQNTLAAAAIASVTTAHPCSCRNCLCQCNTPCSCPTCLCCYSRCSTPLQLPQLPFSVAFLYRIHHRPRDLQSSLRINCQFLYVFENRICPGAILAFFHLFLSALLNVLLFFFFSLWNRHLIGSRVAGLASLFQEPEYAAKKKRFTNRRTEPGIGPSWEN